MQVQYRPLPPIWPSGPRTQYRTRSRFRTSYDKTITMLERELRMLGVRYNATLVIEAGYRESDIRNDGMPRANARPTDPAIILNFESKFGPLRYGCDTYVDWLDNLYAITLALEALRAVDRYGVTKRGEQYQGWKALPEFTMSQREAVAFLETVTGRVSVVGSHDDWRFLYRDAAKKLHPDVGGDRDAWEQLQRAKAVLGI